MTNHFDIRKPILLLFLASLVQISFIQLLVNEIPRFNLIAFYNIINLFYVILISLFLIQFKFFVNNQLDRRFVSGLALFLFLNFIILILQYQKILSMEVLQFIRFFLYNFTIYIFYFLYIEDKIYLLSIQKNLIPAFILFFNFVLSIAILSLSQKIDATIIYCNILHFALAFYIREKIDITRSKENLMSIANSIPAMVWISGINKKRYYFNNAWLDFTGRTQEQEYENGWMSSLIHDDYEKYLAVHLHNFNSRMPFEIKYKLKRHDGLYRWVMDKSIPLYHNDTFYGYMGACIDIHDNVELTEKLKKEEARYQLVTRGIGVGFWEWDVLKNIVFWSDNFKAILRKKTDGNFFTLDDFLESLHPADHEKFERKLNDHLVHRKPYQCEFVLIRDDGTIVECSVNGMAEWDENGDPIRMAGSIHDLSVIRENEKTIKRLTLAMENAVEGIAKLNANGDYVYVNDSYASLFNKTPAEMLNLNWRHFVDSREHQSLEHKFRHLLELNKISFEESFLKAGGGMLNMQGTIVAEFSDSGEYEGCYSFAKDATYKIETEKILRDKKIRLETIFETAVDGILIADSEFKIESFNPACERVFGISKDDIIGFGIEKIIPSCKTDLILENLGSSISIETQGNYFSKNGEISSIPIDFSINELVIDQQKFYSAIVRDISERKQAEERIEKVIERLTNSNTELERFAYIASHDLQEPLRIVSIFSQLIAEKYSDLLDDKAKKYISFSTNAAKHMQELINDLLEYAKVNQEAEALSEVDCNKALKFAIDNLSESIDNSSACIISSELPIVRANPIRLTRLFQNLIGNSIKYRKTDVKPQIKISHVEGDLEWLFCIEDNGIGIEKKYSENIFLPFKRLHNKDQYSGTGIGLAICKKIINGFGGDLWVESEIGNGSKFYFTILK